MTCRLLQSFKRAAFVLLALQASCTGKILGDAAPGSPLVNGSGATSGADGPNGPNGPNGPTVMSTPPMAARCDTPAVGESPMRRLTSREYDNAINELLGDNTRPASTFPLDNRIGIFDNTAIAQTVPVLLAEKYVETADHLAKGVKDINALVGCDVKAAMASDCVRSFITRFGQRAYRRPLTTEETQSLLDIWTSTTAASDAEMGVRGVLTAILVSPHFLFRPEFGNGAASVPGALKASPFEVASRLASLLWSSIPDDALLQAAAKGELETRAQLSDQAKRLLEDPRARAATSSFYEQWLDLQRLSSASKDAALYPEFDSGLKTSMTEEAKRFVDYVVWDGDSRAATLFSAPFSFLNARMAKHYGVAGPADDATFERVDLDAGKFAGFLTQPAYMTGLASPTESSPFKRGAWVRRRLLCQDLPDPPNDVPNLPKPKAGLSLRERAQQHSASAVCSGCHQLIDGLGFGLENYDALGRFREMEGDEPIDASGAVTNTEDADGAFDGGVELAARLAGSEQVRRCVATQWLRYTLARRESADDSCALAQLQTAFQKSDGDLMGLMVELTQTDAFSTYRAPKEAP